MFKVKDEGIEISGTFRLENDGTLWNIDGNNESWEMHHCTCHHYVDQDDHMGRPIYEGDTITFMHEIGVALQHGIIYLDGSVTKWEDTTQDHLSLPNTWRDMAEGEFFIFEDIEEIFVRGITNYRPIDSMIGGDDYDTRPVTKVTVKAIK